MQKVFYRTELDDFDSEGYTKQQVEVMLSFLQWQIKALIYTRVNEAYLDMGNHQIAKAAGLKGIKLPVERRFIDKQELWTCSCHHGEKWFFAIIYAHEELPI